MKSARERVPDHFRYRKVLLDGRILRTKVSHAQMQYGAKLWGQIWKFQLDLRRPEQFWECLRNGEPVDRGVAPAGPPPEPKRLPVGLVISLTKVVGLDEADVMAMTQPEADARWQDFLRSLGDDKESSGG